MKFRLRALLIATLASAACFAFYRPFTDRLLSPQLDGYFVTNTMAPVAYPFTRGVFVVSDPRLQRHRIVALNRLTTSIDKPYQESPEWFTYELFSDGRGLECFVNDKRIYATDSVQIFYSVDDQPPRLVIVPYDDYPKHTAVSPDEIWQLYVELECGIP